MEPSSILLGLCSSVLYAFVGYISGRIKDGEMKFDLLKVVQTIISGLIVGIILMFFGIEINYNSVSDTIQLVTGNVFFVYLMNKIQDSLNAVINHRDAQSSSN